MNAPAVKLPREGIVHPAEWTLGKTSGTAGTVVAPKVRVVR
jgi:hypothetical protein